MHPLNGRSQLLFGVPGMVVGTRGARGPVRNLYIFFFKRNGPHSYDFILGPATIAVALEAACMKPMELLLVSLQWKETHWKQKQPPACRIHVQLFESTCKRKSILHSFFIQQHSKRNHQSKLLTKACIFAATTSESHHRDACA